MDIYFEVKSSFGKIIRTTLSHWELITKLKHPEIEGKEIEVQKCLSEPIEIRKSSEDSDVYLYHSSYMRYYICVVVRHLNGGGFIITAYITDKIKEGESIWKK
ncbi:MAG: hypothetical protein QMD01_04825 [Thermodesulfovibrionales bacterium]|nr:hypothetical protein [Thermodesulfovibrionales bacterium]